MANDCIPFMRPGEDITCHASSAVTGKRLVAISGDRATGPGLAASAEGANVKVAPCDGTTMVPFGVAKYDAASGAKVGVIREGVVPIKAGANIAAGVQVMADATGQVITYVGPTTTNAAALLSVPVVVGICLSGVLSGADAEIALKLT